MIKLTQKSQLKGILKVSRLITKDNPYKGNFKLIVRQKKRQVISATYANELNLNLWNFLPIEVF